MKKIISMICICFMIFSLFHIAYAGVDNGKDYKGIGDKKITEENKGYKEEQKNVGDKEIKEQVNILNEQIKQNNEQILNLRVEIRDITISIQNKVSKLSLEKAVMTQAEVSDLQTVLSLVKNSKKGIKEFRDDGLKQCLLEGKTARSNNELGRAKEYMEKSIDLQEHRKTFLSGAINDLKTAEQLLSQYEELN